jgi:hypothetical protein
MNNKYFGFQVYKILRVASLAVLILLSQNSFAMEDVVGDDQTNPGVPIFSREKYQENTVQNCEGMLNPEEELSTKIFLKKEDIKANHAKLKSIVNSCYIQIGENYGNYFNPGEKWQDKGNFIFKMSVNFCAMGIQWAVKTKNTTILTDFEILKDLFDKTLIASNTSAFQWEPEIKDLKDFHVLAWPCDKTRSRNFYSYELMKVNYKPSKPLNILEARSPGYLKVNVSEMKQLINFMGKIVNEKTLFRDLTSNQIDFLKKAEEFFPEFSFLYCNKIGYPINFFNINRCSNIKIFLLKFKFIIGQQFKFNENSFNELPINDIYFTRHHVQTSFPEEDCEFFLDDSRISPLDLYAYLLNQSKTNYKGLTSNPIEETRKIYPSYMGEEIDIFHSESLFTWVLTQHSSLIGEMYQEQRKKIEGEIVSAVPLYYFYTERQTCPSCENIVQKKSFKEQYVPIISFKDVYSPEYILSGAFHLKFPKNNKINYPYTEYAMLPELSFMDLVGLTTFTVPLDTQTIQLQSNYISFLQRNLKLMETDVEKIQKEIEEMCCLINYQGGSSVKKPVPIENSQSPQTFESRIINYFKYKISSEKQALEEKEYAIQQQKKEINGENTMLKLKEKLQRIPIQYKLD